MAKPSIVHVNFVTDICELFVLTFTLIQQLSSLAGLLILIIQDEIKVIQCWEQFLQFLC